MNDTAAFRNRPLPTRLRLAAWCVGAIAVAALGLLRTATDAEYIFASAAILPVAAISWISGQRDGLALSLLAAVMWTSADLLSQRQFSMAWIPFVNGLTHFFTNAYISYLTARVSALLEREKELASHDPLTGLFNRRAFYAAGEAEASRSQRYGKPLAVAFLDLDDFKRLNDSRGHEAGDLALKKVAACLQGSLRTNDHVARLGGDEFALLLPEASYDATIETGHKIGAAADAALKEFSPVTLSIGIAWFERAERDFPAMLDAADALMYEIKQEGKRGVRIRRFASSADDRAVEDIRRPQS